MASASNLQFHSSARRPSRRLDHLGELALFALVSLACIGMASGYAFVFVLGHLMLHTFPVTVPLLLAAFWLAARRLNRMF